MKRFFILFFLLLALMNTQISAQSQSSSYKATTRKPTDKVEFVSEGRKLIVNVSSADGIGSATITRTGGKWPRKMIIRFNLKNLEHIQISDGITAVEGHLGENQWDMKPPQNGEWKANIKRMGDFIEAEVPAVLLQESSKEIVVKWINEYR